MVVISNEQIIVIGNRISYSR